jgi:hypothetical protein
MAFWQIQPLMMQPPSAEFFWRNAMQLGPQSFALLFTVVLWAVTAYFLLGSLPLLVLKHDNPMDSNFIRSFCITYFRIALLAAVAAVVSYALAGRYGFALGAASIALLTWLLRSRLITRMDELRSMIHANELMAIPEFLKMHKTTIGINTSQLLAILASLGFF